MVCFPRLSHHFFGSNSGHSPDTVRVVYKWSSRTSTRPHATAPSFGRAVNERWQMPCSQRDSLRWHRESEPSNRDPGVSGRVAQCSFTKIISLVVIFHLLAGCHELNCILYYFPSDYIFCVDKSLYAQQPRHGSLCTSREIVEHTQVPPFVSDSLGEHLYL